MAQDESLFLTTMAPVILEFTEWVLKKAQEEGKERLYFLARDAYPIFLTAEKLCAARGIELDCRYLRVSRFALRTAEYHLMGEDCVERLCIGGIRVTFRKILARGGVETATEAIAEELGLTGSEDRVLSHAEIMQIKTRLRACQTFQEAIRQRSEEAYPRVLGYLEQEGLLENVPYALVDSGWIGTLQQTMETLLRTRKPEIKLSGYYFGLYERPRGTDACAYHSFYFSPMSGLYRKIRFSNCLFEALCTAPHGMTVRYRKGEGGFVPIEDGEGLNREKIQDYTALMQALALQYSEQKTGAKQPLCSARLLGALMGHPQRWEAEAFGALLFCDDVREKTVQELAVRQTTQEIRDQRLLHRIFVQLGLIKGEIHESAWIEGSIVRNGDKPTWMLFHARLNKCFVHLRQTMRSLLQYFMQKRNTT